MGRVGLEGIVGTFWEVGVEESVVVVEDGGCKEGDAMDEEGISDSGCRLCKPRSDNSRSAIRRSWNADNASKQAG